MAISFDVSISTTSTSASISSASTSSNISVIITSSSEGKLLLIILANVDPLDTPSSQSTVSLGIIGGVVVAIVCLSLICILIVGLVCLIIVKKRAHSSNNIPLVATPVPAPSAEHNSTNDDNMMINNSAAESLQDNAAYLRSIGCTTMQDNPSYIKATIMQDNPAYKTSSNSTHLYETIIEDNEVYTYVETDQNHAQDDDYI